jgi:dephospho-CoA kinase
MGKRNFMVEGVSGSGKTSVCDALIRRGYHALHGDRVLRPDAGHPHPLEHPKASSLDEAEIAARIHQQAIWDMAKVLQHLEDHQQDVSYFCGGFRNHAELLGLFDGVFVLEVDAETLMQRLSRRPADEFGGRRSEQALIIRLHATREDMPRPAISIDATQPVDRVADQIIRMSAHPKGQ